MKQDYFIVVLAHSLHGRLRRIHVPHSVVYGILILAVLGFFSFIGFVSSYARMAWKVANYNSLRREVDSMRQRYQKLQAEARQTDVQMASLQMFAKEVSLAYGIKQKLEGPPGIASEGKLLPTFAESVADYNYLRSSTLPASSWSFNRRLQVNTQPNIWPINGRLMSSFGERSDPFSGEGAWHTGLDISGPQGEPVRVTADGVVSRAEWSTGYGRLIIVDHGNGMQTWYAHLSRFNVIPGQEVRRGDVIGLVGSTGRVTAPHLHYEVRMGGVAVNPYRYLAHAGIYQQASAKKDFPF